MDRLAYHLAKVVGSWCGRLAGQEEERAGRGAARGPGPHGALSPTPTAPRRAPVRTRADTPEHVPARLSEEEAASARCERLGRREASRQEAAERAAETVGARPIRITSQLVGCGGATAAARPRLDGGACRGGGERGGHGGCDGAGDRGRIRG